MRALAVVVSVGARTSLGLGARETALLYRAGLAGMAEAPILDPNEEPATMCLQPTLDPYLVGSGRVLRLSLPAMDEALIPLGEALRGLRTKLVVCVDEHLAKKRDADGVVPGVVVATMLRKRAEELGLDVKLETNARGPAGAALALPEELDALAQGRLDALVVGGVHSDYDPEVVLRLGAASRLYSPEHLDAMIPGEAAAFCVLVRPDVARRLGFLAHAEINAIGSGVERARPDNDESAYEALGMTTALRKAGEVLTGAGARAGWLIHDATFEMFRMCELQAVLVRCQPLLCEPQHLDFPCQRLGYLGAATIPVEIALASMAFRHGFAPSPVAIACAGSDAGERAALVLSDPAA